jgi:hypothetical protein
MFIVQEIIWFLLAHLLPLEVNTNVVIFKDWQKRSCWKRFE